MQQITIYIPNRDRLGELQCQLHLCTTIQGIVHELTERFGGCTRLEGTGQYNNITEHTTLLQVIVEDDCNPRYFPKLAEKLRETLNQSSVLYTRQPIIATFV